MRRRKDVVVHLYRKVLVSLVAVVALGAVGAGSAAAAAWHVGGEELKASAGLASATKSVEGTSITVAGGALDVSCTGIELQSASIAPASGGSVGHLVLTGCTANDFCSLAGNRIESKALKVEAALGSKSPEDTLVLKPVSGSVFAEFTMQGEGCWLFGEGSIEGQAKLTLAKGREELAEQEMRWATTEGSGEFRFDGNSSSLKGAAKAKLSSGKNWSFR